MKKKVRRFAHLLLTFMFLTTTMPGFSGPARADASVELSSLQAGTGVFFAGYQWIVVDPAAGYLLKAGCLPFQLQYDPSGNTSFASASIRTYLNGTSSTDVNINFLGSLPAPDRSIILDHPWTTGPNGNESLGTVTCKIGLMSLGEYMGYTDNHTYFGIISFSHGPGSEWWTRTPCTSPIGYVFAVNGQLGGYSIYSGWEDQVGPIYYHALRPALYLSPTTSISLTPGGDLSVIPTLGEAGTSAVTAGSPSVPAADGMDSTTITVTLKDANGNALSNHLVDLAPSSGSHSVITPASGSAGSPGASVSGTTDSNGQAVFTVTDTYAETVTYTATDITSYGTNTTYTYIPHIQTSQQAQVSFGNATDIVSYGFGLTNENDTIDSASHAVAVTAVPYETDLTGLTAHFTLSYGATATVNGLPQMSGTTVNDFTSPVTYKVTAQDGITEQDWTVTVTKAAPSTANAITAFSLAGANGTIDSTAHTVAVTLPYGTSLNNQVATFNLSPGATATVNGLPQVSGTTANDFTSPVTYKVAAQDGITEQDWTVTVQHGPGLTDITPDRGLAGSNVTLSGSNFGSVAGSVYFQQAGNNYIVSGSNWSDNSAQATLPAGLQPGSVSVSVCNSVYGLTSNWLPFGIIPPEPTINPGGGIYSGSQNVTIGNVASWDTAYYTTDGTSPVGAGNTPGSSAVAYGGSFTVSQSETVKAVVYDNAGGWSSVASAQFTFNSAISPATATFDLGPGSADNKDVPVTVTWNGNTLTDIRNGGATLTPNTDYTVSGSEVTILKSYLDTLSVGTATLIFDFSDGTSAVLNITVKNTSWNNLVWTVPAALNTTTTAALPVNSSGAYTGPGVPPGTSGQGSLAQTGPVPASPVRLYVLKNGQPVTTTDIQIFMLNPSGKWYNVPADGYGAAGGFDLNTGLAAAQGFLPLSVVVVATGTAAGGKYQLAIGTPGPDGLSLNTVVSKSSDITLTVTSQQAETGGGGSGAPPALAITTETLTPGTVGQSYNKTIMTNNKGTAPYTFAVTSGSLPAGLALDAGTGVISGTPTKEGTYTLTVTVKDKSGHSASKSYSLTVVSATPKVTVKDIGGSWARSFIRQLMEMGVVTGYPDETFRPNNSVTRAEFATMLVSALNLTPRAGHFFPDTEGNWAQSFISTAAAYRIVKGYDSSHFGPNDLITREQLATMAVQAAKLAPTTGELPFKDAAEIDAWAWGYVKTAVEEGIVKGYPDGTFRPLDHATRAEAVTVIAGLLKLK